MVIVIQRLFNNFSKIHFMERNKFLKKGIFGLSALLSGAILAGSNKKSNSANADDCEVSPRETKGPFGTKTPAQMIKANIKSDRVGVPLLINLEILDKSNNCKPMANAVVDIWHCDKDGNYSEYGNHWLQKKDFTAVHFLRGRQTSDEKGNVSFLSIYPGWYAGRAPHIHVEIFNPSGKSLLITQLAFPEEVSSKVYSSSLYANRGEADTSNKRDTIFSDSLDRQLATVTGNINDGFTLLGKIIVNT